MKAIYKQKIFLKSKRQPPNLKKLLTKAKFSINSKRNLKLPNVESLGVGYANILRKDQHLTLRVKTLPSM